MVDAVVTVVFVVSRVVIATFATVDVDGAFNVEVWVRS